MWNTECAVIVLPFKTINMTSRTCLDVWKRSERIHTVLNCPAENVTTAEISSVYNSQHTWKLFCCISEIVQDPWVKSGTACFLPVRADHLPIYFEAGTAEEHMEVKCNKFYFINCNLLAVMVWTKWDDGAEFKSDPVLPLLLSSVQPVHSKHSVCIETGKLSWIAKRTVCFGLFKFW